MHRGVLSEARTVSRNWSRLVWGLPLVFCVALACGSDATTTEPQDIDLSFANYPTDFPIAVTSGLTPTFSWKDVRGGSLVIDDYNGNTVTQNEPWQFFS